MKNVFVESEILNKYPNTQIGIIVTKINVLKEINKDIENIKDNLYSFLMNIGINKENMYKCQQISIWRKIFKDFGVKDNKYCSSVEALVKRVLSGNKMWTISNVVDLYNCRSVMSLCPIGATDLDKVQGDIYLRYGKSTDIFEPLGQRDNMIINNKQIVYADEKEIICHMWNFRESKNTIVSEESKNIIFFIDLVLNENMKQIIGIFLNDLNMINAEILTTGILDKNNKKFFFEI